MKPLISIIVPIYNVEKYLEECICSALNQTYENLEIILINDGSTDSSWDICKKLQIQDKRIKLINKENEGAAITRNLGIDLSTGDYIYFLDADDYMDSHMIEKMYYAMIDTASDLAIVNVYREQNNDLTIQCFDEKNHIYNFSYDSEKENYISEKILFENGHRYSIWNRLFKANIIKKNNIYFENHRYAEDLLYNIKYLLCISRIIYISTPLYTHFQRSNSVSNSRKKDLLVYLVKVANDCSSLFDKKNINYSYALSLVYIQLLLMGIYNEVNSKNTLALSKSIEYYCQCASNFELNLKNNKSRILQQYSFPLKIVIFLIINGYYKLSALIFVLKKG